MCSFRQNAYTMSPECVRWCIMCMAVVGILNRRLSSSQVMTKLLLKEKLCTSELMIDNFASRDVILITFNHRLTTLDFFHTSENTWSTGGLLSNIALHGLKTFYDISSPTIPSFKTYCMHSNGCTAKLPNSTAMSVELQSQVTVAAVLPRVYCLCCLSSMAPFIKWSRSVMSRGRNYSLLLFNLGGSPFSAHIPLLPTNCAR